MSRGRREVTVIPTPLALAHVAEGQLDALIGRTERFRNVREATVEAAYDEARRLCAILHRSPRGEHKSAAVSGLQCFRRMFPDFADPKPAPSNVVELAAYRARSRA